MAKRDEKEIVLGSGKFYVVEFTGTLPEITTMKTDENLLGLISGGATLKYSTSQETVKDDLGIKSKTILTEEEATLALGVMTWNGQTLTKLTSTARVTEDATAGTRTVKLGGLTNDDGKKYACLFYHEDKQDGDVMVQIVGKNSSEMSITFKKDEATVIDAEYKAESMDNEGTLIVYTEQITKS